MTASTAHHERHVIGVGILTWDSEERRSDRYGYVWLHQSGGSAAVPLDVPADLLDTPCALYVMVIETRQSAHIGDFFRGVFPRTPEVGQLIKLGMGLLSLTVSAKGDKRVGLIPVESRDSSDWLNIRALYDAHDQTVELIVEQIPARGAPLK